MSQAIAWENYETVAQLKNWFITHFPMGRLAVEVHQDSLDLINGTILVTTHAYRDINDPHPAASNIANGFKDAYPPHMRKFWVEDTVTSSYGRTILLLKESENTASRLEMEKTEYIPRAEVTMTMREATRDPWTVASAIDELGAQIMSGTTQDEPPRCAHGSMLWKEGTSAKTGNAYKGFTCSSKVRDNQCPAQWVAS